MGHAELQEFARHNGFYEHEFLEHTFVAHYVTTNGQISTEFVYHIRIGPLGNIQLFPQYDSSFAKEMDSIEQLVERLNRDCQIKSSLP